MARDPAADLETLTAIHGKAQAGAHDEAAALAADALADGLEHPLLLNLTALRDERLGRLTEAVAALQRAVKIAPRDVGSRNALGLLLLRLERPAEAHSHFLTLSELEPSMPFVHVNLGNTYFALGLIAEAEASYRRALERDPRHGVALAGLANISSGRGIYPEARRLAERALEALPGLPDAVMTLAAADLGERRIAAAEARLRAMLEDGRLSPPERAYANGLLGDVLDAKDYTADAHAAYTLCNEQLRAIHAGRFDGDGNALSYVAAMADAFGRSPPAVWAARPSPDPRRTGAAGHVFLLGFPRSGTTLLEVILEGHPNIVSLEENESLVEAVDEFMRRPEDQLRIATAPEATLERHRTAYWRQVSAAGVDVGAKLFVDKNPLNTLKLPLIARLFPDAKILFACRDPRDIVWSCFRHRFKMSAPIYELLTLDGAARYYDAVMRLYLRLNGMVKLETCLVRHEDVVTDFRREMKRICGFLGIDWDPAMGDFALRTRERESLTPSTAQLVKGLNTEGIGQWLRYRGFLEPVLPLLEPWVTQFLYDR